MSATTPRLLDPAHRLLLVGVVCLITVVAVESMAISTVMPIVEADLGGIRLYGWVFSGFYLGTLVGVVLGGRAADRVAPVVPMGVGISVFLVGLVVGGLAPDMPVLIAGRVLQGLGAGVVPAVAYVCVGRGFPAQLRPKVFAVMSTAWVVPSLVSPLLAAELAESVGWRWVFLGLVPVTVVVALLGVPAVRTVRTPRRGSDHPATPLGAVVGIAAGAWLVLVGLGADVLVLAVPVAALGLVVGVGAFRRLTPPGTLSARAGLPAAVLTRGVLTCAFFSADAFVSLAMTSVRGTTTRTAGVVLASASLSWTAGSWIQARFALRWGPTRLVATGGVSLLLGATTMVASLHPLVPTWTWLAGGMLSGLGMGLAYPQLAVVTLERAEPGREGEATSSLQMSDILGIVLGTGLAGVLVGMGDRFDLGASQPLAAVFVLSGVAAVGVATLAPRLAADPSDDADERAGPISDPSVR